MPPLPLTLAASVWVLAVWAAVASAVPQELRELREPREPAPVEPAPVERAPAQAWLPAV